MWPNGQLAEPVPTRSEEEKLRTRLKAKEKFLLIQPGTHFITTAYVQTRVSPQNPWLGHKFVFCALISFPYQI